MKTIFVTHNGLGTAVVQSQVLPYVRGLIAGGIDIRLITFERDGGGLPADFPKARWRGLRSHPGRHLISKVQDVAAGVLATVRAVLSMNADLIHARSYVPAAIAWLAGALTRRPFIFDMRGFLGEEYVDAGLWHRGDVRYRVLRIAERVLLRGAAHVVVLTEAAAMRLRRDPEYSGLVGSTPITVVPCMVDLSRFTPTVDEPAVPTAVYSGSLGMWYRLDEMLLVYRHARELVPELRFLILNRGDHRLVADAVERLGLTDARVELRAIEFGAVPAALSEATVGIALLKRVPSKIGSSPIKVAEFLAAGLPVIVDAWTGDLADEVRAYGAGHVVASYDDAGLRAAGAALASLLADRAARRSARRLAEEHYDLRVGIQRYRDVYESVARRRGGV